MARQDVTGGSDLEVLLSFKKFTHAMFVLNLQPSWERSEETQNINMSPGDSGTGAVKALVHTQADDTMQGDPGDALANVVSSEH